MLNNFPLRTALCITGLPRTMEYCYPSQKQHLLDVYHPDVFVCASSDKSRIQKLYNPTGMIFIDEDHALEEATRLRQGLTPVAYPPSALPFSYKTKLCVEQMRKWERDSGRPYDLVFISRFDVKFKSIQPVELPEENTLYVPRIGAYWATPPAEPGIHWGGFSGHLCWTTPRVAEMIANVYYAPEDWHGRSCASSETWGNAAEYLLKYFCDHNGIQARLVEIEMMLIRGTPEAPLSFNWQDLSAYPDY